MRRTRHPRAARAGRLVRGLRPDRNPLRRGTDRLEAAILAVLFAALCMLAPLAAIAASGWEHSTSEREIRVQQATCHQVSATLLNDAEEIGAYPVLTGEAHVRWTTSHGQTMTELLRVPAGAKAGSVIRIWTDASGQLISPLRQADIPVRDDLAAAAAVTAVCVIVLLAGLAARRILNYRRMTAWGIDWLATEPRWNTRR